MRLNKAQFQQTEAAILHAFDRDALRRMLRRQLDEDLDVVAGDDELATVVFNLVTWAERNSRVSELIAGALAENPNNAELKQLAADYRRWEAAPQSQQPAPAPPPVQQPTPVYQTPVPPPPRRSVPGWILGLAGIVVVALITVLLVTNGGIPWSGSATSTPPTVSDAGSAQETEPADIPSNTSTPSPTASERNEETATANSSGTATPKDTPAADSDSPSLITNNVVNVRSGPGTSYQILETVDAGRTFPILAQTEAGDWYQILLNGTRGWINSALVTATNANNAEIVEIVSTAASATPLPAATASTASPTLSSGGCIAGRSITNPASGQTIPRGYVTIEGEADLNAANGYVLSYGLSNDQSTPSLRPIIVSPLAKSNGALGVWNTQALAPGSYILQLHMPGSLQEGAAGQCTQTVTISSPPIPDIEPKYQLDTGLPQGSSPLAPKSGETFSANTGRILFQWQGDNASSDQLYDIRIFRSSAASNNQVDVAFEWNLPVPALWVDIASLTNPSPGKRNELEAAGLDTTGEYRWQVRLADFPSADTHRYSGWGQEGVFQVNAP